MHVAHIEHRVMGAVPAVVGTFFVASASALPALCPFRVLSGHACPLCGMTRAIRSLVTGDVGMAIRYHPLVLLLMCEAAVIGLLSTRTGARPPANLMRSLVGANAIAFAVVWLVRWRLDVLSFVVD